MCDTFLSLPIHPTSDVEGIVITRAVKGKDGAMWLGMPPACTRQALKNVPPAQGVPNDSWWRDGRKLIINIDSLMTTPNSSILGWTTFVHPENRGSKFWTHFDCCIFFRWVEKNHQRKDTEGMGLLSNFDCSHQSCWITVDGTPQTSELQDTGILIKYMYKYNMYVYIYINIYIRL